MVCGGFVWRQDLLADIWTWPTLVFTFASRILNALAQAVPPLPNMSVICDLKSDVHWDTLCFYLDWASVPEPCLQRAALEITLRHLNTAQHPVLLSFSDTRTCITTHQLKSTRALLFVWPPPAPDNKSQQPRLVNERVCARRNKGKV